MSGYLDTVSVFSTDSNIRVDRKSRLNYRSATDWTLRDSESSYEHLFTTGELTELVTFLNFDLTWMFTTTMASVVLYIIFTYSLVFENNFEVNSLELLVMIICGVIVIVDVFSMILHLSLDNVAARRDIARRNRGIATLDVIALISLFHPLFPNIMALSYVFLAMEVFRMYRVFRYFYTLSLTADLNTTFTLLRKYALLFILFVHSFACAWNLLSCYKCSSEKNTNWTETAEANTYIKEFKLFDMYIMCLYYTMTMITTVGFGDIHGFSYTERMLTVAIMLTGYTFFTATFLGGWTAVQVEHYRRHAQFQNRLGLIKEYLSHPRIPTHTAKQIYNFYLTFWHKKGAIRNSVLFNSLPLALRQQVLVDSYWFFLQQSYFMRHASDPFKTAISLVMKTRIVTEGERLYDCGKQKEIVVYVTSGSVRIHSAQDNESPILTLGVGTLLGESCLLYSSKSPVRVTASGFCVVQVLHKRDFWREASKYAKLKQVERIHQKFKVKMEDAKMLQMERVVTRHDGPRVKALKFVKGLLQPEKPKTDEGYFHTSDTTDEVRAYYDLYTLSKSETEMKNSDDIFARTTWPWTFRPHCSFLSIWEYVVVATVIFVAFLYPYNFAFGEADSTLIITAVVIDTIYMLDIIFQTCTAMEVDNVIFSEVSDTFQMRMGELSYTLDLLATIPVDHIAKTLGVTKDPKILSLLSANRLFKIQRIILFANNLGNNFEFNIPLMRCIKYVLYLCMTVYFMGSFYYIIACYKSVCAARTWYSKLVETDGATGVRHKYPFHVSMYFAILVLSQTGYGDITATNCLEMQILLAFFTIGILTFSYLVADYSATLMLSDRAITSYRERVMVIRRFLVENHIVFSIQRRVNYFLLLQWEHDRGYKVMKDKFFMYDCPDQFFTNVKTARYSNLLAKIPLFQEVKREFISAVCVVCQGIYLPPNEMVIYGGETAREMYIIERGQCLVMSAVSGKIEKILGPGSYFSVIETLLVQPALNNIQTVTDARLIRITHEDFKKVLKKFPDIADDIRSAVEFTLSDTTVERLFVRRSGITYKEIEQGERMSWDVFPKSKLHPKNIDYLWGFRNAGFANIFRLVMMRRTIVPNGSFMMCWEIGRAISAFLCGMIYPESAFMEVIYPNFRYYLLPLDISAITDIYIRLHVGYYNMRGILVTHPKYTALNYMAHAFVLDLLSVFPMEYVPYLFQNVNYKSPESVQNFYKVNFLLRFNRLLQMYRLPDAFSYFQEDKMKRKGVLFNILRFFPITLVFLNFLTGIMLQMSTKVVYDAEESKLNIEILHNTWLHHHLQKEPYTINHIAQIYFVTYYWITQTCLVTGFGDIVAKLPSGMYFVVLSIIAGYLMFTYVLVVISSSIANINSNLTTYQEYVRDLVSYMKREKLGTELQKKAIDHFEFIWRRTHGLTIKQILQQCHVALRQDCILSLYEQTLTEVPLFFDLGKTFFRIFGTHLTESYFLKDNRVIRLNDIINTVYIIHKGEALVIGPDGSVFDVLSRGCMFGNIDDVPSSRSMVEVVANSSLHLLSINTKKMYLISEEYPSLKNRMQRHILTENLSYVMKKNKMEARLSVDRDNFRDFGSDTFLGKVTKVLTSTVFRLICMLSAFASCVVVLYQVSFQKHTPTVLIITYALDIFHVFKIFISLNQPYKNNFGEIVTDKAAIKRRYMSSHHFYFELFTLLPLELLAFAAPMKDWMFYLSILRLNKMFRLMEINSFFNVTYDSLNVNILAYNLSAIIVYLFLMLHVGTCILYIIGCPATKCSKKHWTFDSKGNNLCSDAYYFCSLYFMTAVTTSTGIGDLVPRHVSEMMVMTVLMICTKFTVAVFIGQMSALVQNYTYSLVNYNHGIMKLKEFLRNNDVSGPLVSRILEYISLLWKRQKGYQQPLLLLHAPSFLKEEIKGAAYGHHLYENYIFVSCHEDFLRILISRLDIRTFFCGDKICQQGVINNRMYFIHSGKVEVLVTEQNMEVLVDELFEKDCFGVVQGLYFKTPHTHTFKAASVCVILYLELDKWVDMLHYFPSARYEIYERIVHFLY